LEFQFIYIDAENVKGFGVVMKLDLGGFLGICCDCLGRMFIVHVLGSNVSNFLLKNLYWSLEIS
jgi:hypothetical protein